MLSQSSICMLIGFIQNQVDQVKPRVNRQISNENKYEKLIYLFSILLVLSFFTLIIGWEEGGYFQ